MQYLLIKIFMEADDFCQKLVTYITTTQISDKPTNKLRISPSKTLTLSEGRKFHALKIHLHTKKKEYSKQAA